MALATLPGDEDKDQLNPGQQDYDRRFNDIAQQEASGSVNDSGNSKNSSDLKDSESKIDTSEDWSNKYTGGGGKQKLTLKGAFANKKRNVLVSIIIVLLGGGGILGGLLAPGIGIVQLKEVLTGDLNDQLAAMDIRSEHVFRAKLKGMTSGVCNNVVSIKCKFSTMNERQLNKFRKAGFDIPDTAVEKTKLGRYRIITMTTPDGIAIKNPNDLINARNSSPAVRSAMKRVFNPVYYGLSDKVANTFFQKNKVSKQKVITSTSEEENRKTLKGATMGDKVVTAFVPMLDNDGVEYAYDKDGKRVSAGDPGFDEAKKLAQEKAAGLSNKATVGGKATTGILTGGIKGISVIGALDSACTVYNTARAVSAMAKVARSMQLVQFAMAINTAADSIKAGDATPEEVNFVGTMLNETDTRKQIIDEQSESAATGSNNLAQPTELRDNPFYGKSAFDSPGVKAAMYNDAPVLTSRSQQYMIGGGLTGTLSSVLDSIESTLKVSGPADIRNTCGNIQSPWTRAAGFIGGIFMAIGTLGWGTAISVAASVAVSFALPFLEAMMADVVAGQVIGEDIKGVDAGDALFAGTSAMLGGVAMNRGMTPMSLSGIKEYAAATTETESKMIAHERYEAAQKPFDVSNQYSFLGSFARSLYPTYNQAKTSTASALTGVASIISKGFSSIFTPVSASGVFNENRFQQCQDPGYEELGIDADIFCNVRYGLTPAELAMDTDTVVDFMVDNEHISDSGSALSDQYKTFMKYCVNREDGWGETSEENGPIGAVCLDSTPESEGGLGVSVTISKSNLPYFRVYTMDNTIGEAMDDEQKPSGQAAGTTIDMENLYQDSTAISCAAGTEYVGLETGYRQGNPIPITLCAIPESIATAFGKPVLVNSRVSGAMLGLMTQMKTDLGKMDISDSFRTYAEQEQAKREYGDRAAAPGFSNHQMGIAIDFQLRDRNGNAANYGASKAPGESKEYDWLVANASKYGYQQLSHESWHWSPDGG